MSGQTLIEMSILARQMQVPQLDLTVRPGQLEGPGDAMEIMVMIRQSEGLLAAGGHGGAECQADGTPRGNTDTTPQAEDGIQHRPCGPRQDSAGLQGCRGSRRSAAAQETCSVRLVLHLPQRLPFDGQNVDGPDGLLVGGTRPAAAQQGMFRLHKLRFQEE